MPEQKFRSFAIFGAMRSGSNLLERYINQFDGLKCHGELFNPAFIGWSGKKTYMGVKKPERDVAPDGLIDAILAKDAKNIPGFRIFRDHNSNAIDLFLADPSCAKIILTRNPVDSFVSLKIARKTDQWLIEDEKHRKIAQIFFDMREFEEYRKIRLAYSKRIASQLKESGQSFFGIRYDQLGDIDKINEIGRFIGAKKPLKTLKQSIKRQNPGPMADKIVNYSEVYQKLDLPAPVTGENLEPKFMPEKGTDLSRAYFCSSKSIIFAPIPSAPDGSVRKWLTKIDGVAPENDFGNAAFKDWQTSHKNPIIFTVLRHPVARAYDVFMRKIFRKNSGSFIAIREILETKFGVFLPAKGADFAKIGYDISAHRAAFKQFLAFIHHNLTQDTTLRTDGRWRGQSDLINGYITEFGQCMAVQEQDLNLVSTYISNRLNLAADVGKIEVANPDWPFDLHKIYDAEIETLARTAYGKDYQKFGFENWR
ncbi:MAG: hypothetical protein L3J33_00990 [Rhodobacteraceae bacterium]|nr:hypothetical protein [Paracoccaceae bacterium]